jgi:hypothetical protein
MIPITLDTKKLKRLVRQLATLQERIGKIMDATLRHEIGRVEKNHRNIVAAHKAHRTMAKKARQK